MFLHLAIKFINQAIYRGIHVTFGTVSVDIMSANEDSGFCFVSNALY